MKIIDGKIWLEVTDWGNVGYKLYTIIHSIGKTHKSWSCVNQDFA